MAHVAGEVDRSSSKPSQHGRSGNGKFARGNGFGSGRPLGYRSQIAQALDDIDPQDVAAIRDAIVRRAKEGDVQAAKLIFDRCWPAPKSRAVKFDLPPIETAAEIPKATAAVLKALASGNLTPEECTAVASIIEQHRKALDLVEVEGRLSRAEEAVSEAPAMGGNGRHSEL